VAGPRVRAAPHGDRRSCLTSIREDGSKLSPAGRGGRPSVEIIIPSFNTRTLLHECLSSIARHLPKPELLDVKISVFENGSTDGSAQMVESEFREVRLVRSQKNLGFARAVNALAEASTARYLMPLNSDTIWVEDILTPLVERLETEADVALVAPRLVFPGTDKTQLSTQLFPGLRFELALMLRDTRLAVIPGIWDAPAVVRGVRQEGRARDREPRDAEFIWATCWLVRRSAVPGTLFDESFFFYDEDLDLCTRLRKRGARIVYDPTVRLEHHGSGSTDPAARALALQRARHLYYRRNRGRLIAGLYLLIVEGVPFARRLGRVPRRLARLS